MNQLISDPVESQPTPDVTNAVDALVAEMDSAAISEVIQVRVTTLTPILKEILESPPPSHWGINE